ncbi:MAG TPA: thioredoxin family protein [Flavipsychrobacter sp.]|nr:thioredoxin family protein [Flavipsychrobacter sp.]
MKNKIALLITSILLSVFTTSIATAQDKAKKDALVWHTDINKAQEISKKQKKPIFAFFTGSDWCGWCHRLQSNVFAKPEFIVWAKKNVILVELDFPRRKELPQELREQNISLQQAFQVQGYPTIWIFDLEKDADKKFKIMPLGSLGYPSGAEPGKEQVKFLSTANEILAKKKDKS